MIRLFGDEVFDEYLTSDNTPAGGVFSITGTASPTTGGYTVIGRWPFCSGQHHSGWMIVPARSDHDGYPLALLVPRTAFEIAGEWMMSGLVGTGSDALSLTDTFIPQRHAIPFHHILDGTGRDHTPDPYWRQPLVPIICALSAGPAIGMATTALTDFTDLISQCGITYSPIRNSPKPRSPLSSWPKHKRYWIPPTTSAADSPARWTTISPATCPGTPLPGCAAASTPLAWSRCAGRSATSSTRPPVPPPTNTAPG
nr:hypothetical protein [Nocardia cyriacigeorgica]